MIRLIIFLTQLFILLFLLAYLSSNSFEITFELKELQYSFSSNFLLFFIVVFMIVIFIIQLTYFKSRYSLQKYFL